FTLERHAETVRPGLVGRDGLAGHAGSSGSLVALALIMPVVGADGPLVALHADHGLVQLLRLDPGRVGLEAGVRQGFLRGGLLRRRPAYARHALLRRSRTPPRHPRSSTAPIQAR